MNEIDAIPLPNRVKIIKLVRGIYFDGIAQVGIDDRIIGAIGQCISWGYSIDGQAIQVMDIEIDNPYAVTLIDVPITSVEILTWHTFSEESE